MNTSTGKRMSPLRALQYSSALDTHSYQNSPSPECELLTLNHQLKQKDSEILSLKLSLADSVKIPSPLKEVGKNITNSYTSNKSQSPSAKKHIPSPYFITKCSINLPNPRFSDFNPITGLNRQKHFNPFQDIGRRYLDPNKFY